MGDRFRLWKAGCRHRADFGECPLLEDEPPFPPGTSQPLETFLIGRLGLLADLALVVLIHLRLS